MFNVCVEELTSPVFIRPKKKQGSFYLQREVLALKHTQILPSLLRKGVIKIDLKHRKAPKVDVRWRQRCNGGGGLEGFLFRKVAR